MPHNDPNNWQQLLIAFKSVMLGPFRDTPIYLLLLGLWAVFAGAAGRAKQGMPRGEFVRAFLKDFAVSFPLGIIMYFAIKGLSTHSLDLSPETAESTALVVVFMVWARGKDAPLVLESFIGLIRGKK